ncbi:LD-carboxypeptidase [Staphylococcus hominis]
MVPYLDENIINNNPKIFMGYSVSTALHLKFFKSKVMSFYGPAVLTDFG